MTVLQDSTRRWPFADGERGTTLIELLVVMILASLVGALSLGAWSGYRETSGLETSTEAVVSSLRNAQGRSQAENVPFVVETGGRTWTVTRGDSGEMVARGNTSHRMVTLSATTFVFSPRGTATPGAITVSGAKGHSNIITVEGMTGRVSVQD